MTSRVANARRITRAAATTASVTARRFSSADSLRIWIEPVVSSTITAPTMSSPMKMGCAAERMATSGSRVPRHCVDTTPINARSISARTGFVSSPVGTCGVRSTRATMGFRKLVIRASRFCAAALSRRFPESPRTRERVSTTHTRDELQFALDAFGAVGRELGIIPQ